MWWEEGNEKRRRIGLSICLYFAIEAVEKALHSRWMSVCVKNEVRECLNLFSSKVFLLVLSSGAPSHSHYLCVLQCVLDGFGLLSWVLLIN